MTSGRYSLKEFMCVGCVRAWSASVSTSTALILYAWENEHIHDNFSYTVVPTELLERRNNFLMRLSLSS